jgi:Tfp pilus assembly protein PilF
MLMKLAGSVFAAVLFGLSLFTIRSWTVVPYRCNATEKIVEQSTLALFEQRPSIQQFPTARDNLTAVRRCLEKDPSNVNLRMVGAANLRILRRLDEAAAEYQRALDFDRRPELYLNLGLVQLELGKQDEAMRNLVRAVHFNPTFIESIPQPTDGFVYREVQRVIGAEETAAKK